MMRSSRLFPQENFIRKLNIGTKFTTWFERMKAYGFSEGNEFFPEVGETSEQGGRPATDYQISIDMAKQICMIQRTPEGKLIRQYFIDLEKAWNTPPFTKKGEHKNMNTEQIIELSRKGLELALANEEYDLTVSETNAIRDYSRDKLDLVTTSYYLGLQRGCVYKENCNTGYKKEIIDLIEHLENKGELEYIYTILSTYLTPKKMGRKELSCQTQ